MPEIFKEMKARAFLSRPALYFTGESPFGESLRFNIEIPDAPTSTVTLLLGFSETEGGELLFQTTTSDLTRNGNNFRVKVPPVDYSGFVEGNTYFVDGWVRIGSEESSILRGTVKMTKTIRPSFGETPSVVYTVDSSLLTVDNTTITTDIGA